ncbi:PA14 domain-containing protein [Luteolibacter flavescens]|uniref:PA14 domain-containing protein n=1 Tax=Luteolibacter flavescens TaxID=1859460 RepID=A0ABT3FQH9_9BACT|nr:PA14 domain-containing protein [Luteolibacter flavescens]MCW1885838.1 PA14 domain-containing protein [Luteolibacter flavescens]
MKKSTKILLTSLTSGAGLLALGWLQEKPEATTTAQPTPATPARAMARKAAPTLPVTQPVAVDVDAAAPFTDIGSLEKGAVIRLPLPDGGEKTGRLNYVNRYPNGAAAAGGDMEDGSGTFEIGGEPWGYRGFILQRQDGVAYVYSSGKDGGLQVARRPLGEVICEPEPHWKPLAKVEGPDPEKAAIYNGGRSVGVIYEAIPILSSLPRAAATIYLDFDGEVIEGHSWEGGRRIIAPAYNLPASEVTDIWRRVAEDFAPFEVNVTTDLQAYLRAPQGMRMRCITTTNNFAGAGGVAFNNTFRESGDPVCWNFYRGNGGAVVISHEVGHTFGLHHDDTTTQGYYGGHGSGAMSWGPIMGAPYSQNICQWSKGDYVNANQQQDDLIQIGSSVARRVDDHAPDAVQATPLVIGAGGSVSNSGIIGSPDDIDAFTFTTGGGTLNLQFDGAVNSPNLDIEAKLYNSAGTLLATASPANQLNATLNTTVAAGTYTVTVDGVGNGTWATNGYDDYGSLGEFTITGTVPSPGWRFRVPVNALNTAVLGTVAPGGSGYSITAGNTGTVFAIQSGTGVLTLANASALVGATTFNLTVNFTSGGSPQSVPVNVRVGPLRGVKQEIWTGLSGNSLSSLTSNANYPNSPNVTLHAGTFQGAWPADNYGQKFSGYLVPTETGNHVFWTAADDISELWLSTDSNPANKVRVAYNNSNTNVDWANQASQQSANIALVAGQRYYIEYLHRENAGGDHAAVAWQTPTLSRRLIGMEYLEFPGTMPNRAPWLANMTFRVREDSGSGTAVGTLLAGDYEPGSVVSGYTITGGNTGSAFSLNATTGALTVNGPLSFATLPKYLLDVQVTDSGGLQRTAQIAVEVEPRAVKREYWSGISGTQITNLTSNANYPNNPTTVTYQAFFETGSNIGDNYGQRLSGYVRAPDTGSYTFWIASDDAGELWLSTDSNPANKVRIAYHTGATNSREWGKFATQRSAAITLEGGKFYYIEALHKEGSVSDNLAVSWSGPDFGQVMLGAPHVTQQFYNHAPPVLENKTVTVFDRDGFVTNLEAKDWSNPGTTVTYSITGGNADGAFTINPATGTITATGSRLPTGNRVLSVTATDNGPTPLSTTASITVNVVRAGLKREVWTGLAGGQGLAELTDSIYFPRSPDQTGFVQHFEAPTNWGDNYGQRLSGYLIAPSTGNFTFWIASDDGGELRLSTDANPANARAIASVTGATGNQAWTQQGSQQSAVIPLVAGQRYYIEALHKEGGGGDHLAVAWQGPGITRTRIPGGNLEYPDSYRPALKREIWLGNTTITPPATAPSSESQLFTFKSSPNVADTYSDRVSGFLVPPATGSYTFWIASDDNSQLRISTDENPANAVQIASVANNTGVEAWDANASQKSAARTLVAGKRYYIEALHRDGTGADHMAVAWEGPGITRRVIGNEYLEHPTAPSDRSLAKREVWTGISGDYLPALTGNAAFPASPSTVTTLSAGAGLMSGTNVADNFGQRLSGYIVAPDHGHYTFWIASDNASELWISTDDNPANRIKVAGLSEHVTPQNWDAQAGQKSAPLAFEAGRRYYFEILHKEGIGGDHLAVAWQGPGFARRVIPNQFLEHPLVIPGKSSIRREVWSGVTGETIADLTGNAAFIAGTPTARGQLATFETPSGHGDNYGQRLTATLVAPESGNFKFWISGDDATELWLSTDANPANKVRVAYATAHTAFREWTKYATQESGSLPLVAGTTYYIEALHKEGGSVDHLSVAWQGPSFTRQVLDGRFLQYPGTPPAVAALKREVWTSIGGNNVGDLTNKPAYPNSPNQTLTLNSFDSPVNWSDNYGQKISAYLIAPKTGDYTFWIASDDGGDLNLATDGNPANKSRVAYTTNATGHQNWTNNANQQSATIALVAGQRCYIEALHKEGGGDDYVSVAWQGPGFGRQIIRKEFLEYPGLMPAEASSGSPIMVLPGNPGFTFWLDYMGLEGADRLATADPDGDGIPNSLEFVLGGKPSGPGAASLAILPKLSLEPTWATFVFRRADVATATDPFVEYGDLSGWKRANDGIDGVQIQVDKNGFEPGVDRVTVRVPRTADKLFLRLNGNQ